MDILRLLDDLNDLATEQPRTIIGPLTWGLDKEEIAMLIAKVRACLPQELKSAASTVRESERIIDAARNDAALTLDSARKESERLLAEAKIEAERIQEQAKLQQERMIAESEILKLSKSQAEAIRTEAERHSSEMKRGSEKYAYDTLVQLENVIGKVMQNVERGKTELAKSETVNQPVTRERTRVM